VSAVLLRSVVVRCCRLLVKLSAVDGRGLHIDSLRAGTGEPVSVTMDLSFLATKGDSDAGVDVKSGVAGSEPFVTISNLLRSTLPSSELGEEKIAGLLPGRTRLKGVGKLSLIGENAGALVFLGFPPWLAIEGEFWGSSATHGVASAISLSEALIIEFVRLFPSFCITSRFWLDLVIAKSSTGWAMASGCRVLGLVAGGRSTTRVRGKGEDILLQLVGMPLDGLCEVFSGTMEVFCLLALDSGLTTTIDEVDCPPLILLSEVINSRGKGARGS
jgi:hypothetical protein